MSYQDLEYKDKFPYHAKDIILIRTYGYYIIKAL